MDITNSDICQHKSSCVQVYHKIINIHPDAPAHAHACTHARTHAHKSTTFSFDISFITTASSGRMSTEMCLRSRYVDEVTNTTYKSQVAFQCSSHPRVQLGRHTTSTLSSEIRSWSGQLTGKGVLSFTVGS